MSDNPFLRREAKHPIGRTGRRSEEKLADRIGARLRPNSGAMTGAKGDMTLDNLLIEAKSTVHDTLQMKLDWLLKIEREARELGLRPAFAINFTDGSGRPRTGGRWIALREDDLQDLLERVNGDAEGSAG